ncbi:MAG: TatD family hydrolase [Saprospiraceae bacterium]|nr:TatD family hydrolase [Saprospiraceae bacterium]
MTKIKIIDSHCHLYSEELRHDWPSIIQRAEEAGVEYIMMPNVDGDSIQAMLEVETLYSQCLPMMGLHPCSVNEQYMEALQEIDEWFAKRSFYGVGETGIDLYWDKTWVEEQKICFDHQIGLAKELGLPVIIHSRDSLDLTISMIEERQHGALKGIFHCFTGTLEQAERIVDAGFLMGIGGVLTYKNSNLPDVVKQLALSNLVLETDAPYLPPVPHRGKKNEPAFLQYVLEKLSETTGKEKEEVAAITTSNAINLFGLAPK